MVANVLLADSERPSGLPSEQLPLWDLMSTQLIPMASMVTNASEQLCQHSYQPMAMNILLEERPSWPLMLAMIHMLPQQGSSLSAAFPLFCQLQHASRFTLRALM
ncbi:hypothetical protein BJV78DRAFT_1158961 [Lactifluus subvellereus]|nr:hypothetical protein BJV78DRAFT_1158961 [Lactifluus subvellereus]